MMVVCACHPHTREEETGRCLELTGQPDQLSHVIVSFNSQLSQELHVKRLSISDCLNWVGLWACLWWEIGFKVVDVG